MTFAVRRAGQQATRLLLVLFAALIVVLGVGGMEGLSARLVDEGVRRIADVAEPGTRAAEVIAIDAQDRGAQDRRVRSAIAEAFPGVPVAVSRLAVSEISVGNPDAVQAIGGDAVTGRGTLKEGAWPSGPGEASVLSAAAQRRGWRLGDRIRLDAAASGGDVTVTVVGIWTAKDPADPAWAGDPAVGSGDSNGAAGPVLVTDQDMARLGTTPTTTWTIRPTALSATTLDAYRNGLAALAQLPAKVDPDNRSSTRVGGAFGDLLDRLTAAVTVARGTLIVPSAIIVALGAVALAVILAALAGVRREELGLRRARGASAFGIAGHAAAETAVVTIAGAVLAILALRPVAPPGAGTLGAAALTVVVAAGIAAVCALRASDPAHRVRSDAGRPLLCVLLLPLVVLALIAGFAVWQLFAQGGVLAPDGSADPVASASGAASLLACALAVPLLAVLAAAIAERAARGGRGIVPVLPLRQIARRAGLTAVAILCLALAAGSATLALGAGPLAAAADRAAARAALGLDVRVAVDGQHDAPLTAGDAGALPSVSRASDVLQRDAVVGADTIGFVAADPAALPVPAAVVRVLSAPRDRTFPVAITASLADRLGAAVGTRFTATLQPDGAALVSTVVAILPDIPGIGAVPGILADLAATRVALGDHAAGDGPANELWVSTDDPAAVAAVVRSRASAPVRILTPDTVSVAPVTATSTVLLGIGSAAAALLGVLGFVAATASDRARRTEERRVLRSLGLAPARQRAARAGEVLGVAVFAVLGGAAAGAVVTAVVLPVMWGSGA
ncbi:hypothetical protein [Microbacterium capsulatum]|uniref:FtsX-like permease family protein n=1 Tax=Microbacterium capsulatum TaxID=3041921 RepID=A0ABU0XCZ8_9MICO|nr:hypothetical protein [Microbacterium sp. ASV81]MDQ4212584.1 hypothetical protein [Microbacterium sp. ASV81]